jgi:type 1 glutamine amidotransferase
MRRLMTGVVWLLAAGMLVFWSAPVARAAAEGAVDKEGFRPIFDGKTLEGWDGDPRFWRVEDGAITGQTTAENPANGNTFLIWRGGEPADFELKIECRLVNHNSGIQFRSWEEPDNWGKWVVGGYQADAGDDPRYNGMLYGERFREFLCVRGDISIIGDDHKSKVVGKIGDAEELLSKIKPGDWNEYHIVARGNHLAHWINGQKMVDCTDNDVKMRRGEGLIALHLHAGPPMKVQFRNIRLKELKGSQAPAKTAKKKIVLVAGPRSHGYASHEHNAGCRLLAKCLNENVPGVEAVVCLNGWPKDPAVLKDAAAIVLYMDGGPGHPLNEHLAEIGALMDKGVGLACLHWATEVRDEPEGKRMLDWIGGYYGLYWSVNPFWTAEFKTLPEHPITRGVAPFAIEDEWYYHMRFRKDMEGVTPILTAIPPDSTREGPDGSRSGNAEVRARKGMPEHVAWARQRPDGGRGFGFTGGHFHWNWANDNYRKLVLNAIVWVAGLEVPAGGVCSRTPTFEELEAGQDYPQPKDFDRQAVKRLLESWKGEAAERN